MHPNPESIQLQITSNRTWAEAHILVGGEKVGTAIYSGAKRNWWSAMVKGENLPLCEDEEQLKQKVFEYLSRSKANADL